MATKKTVLIPSFTGLRLVKSTDRSGRRYPVLIPSFTGLRLVTLPDDDEPTFLS